MNLENKTYTLDLEKLSRDVKAKRNRHRSSWQMVATQSGISQTTLVSLDRYQTNSRTPRKSIDANTLIGIIMWLGQPLEKYIVKNDKKEEGR